MKNRTIASLLSLVIFFSFSCKKASNSTADSGTFTVTTTAGTTYTTKYVNTPIPTTNGTFSLQYQTFGTTASKWMFFILIDNNIKEYLFIIVFHMLLAGVNILLLLVTMVKSVFMIMLVILCKDSIILMMIKY